MGPFWFGSVGSFFNIVVCGKCVFVIFEDLIVTVTVIFDSVGSFFVVGVFFVQYHGPFFKTSACQSLIITVKKYKKKQD